MAYAFEVASSTKGREEWVAQYNINGFIAEGILFYDGAKRKYFAVRMDDQGRFKIAVGSSGHKMVFKHADAVP